MNLKLYGTPARGLGLYRESNRSRALDEPANGVTLNCTTEIQAKEISLGLFSNQESLPNYNTCTPIRHNRGRAC